MAKSLLLFITCLATFSAFGESIEFSEDELARETTLPVFEKRRAVLNRNILTDKHFEFGVGAGLEMNEPYYTDTMFSVMGTYNLSETSAINGQALIWMDGLSSYGEQLRAGGKEFQSFNPDKAPHPKWGGFANYEFIAYYGKISITKQAVMNLNLFGLAGLGYINMGSIGFPALNVGAGQNFFFTKHFALRVDLRWLIFQGPDATSKCLADTLKPGRSFCSDQTTPDPSSFEKRMFYNSQIGLSGVFVL